MFVPGHFPIAQHNNRDVCQTVDETPPTTNTFSYDYDHDEPRNVSSQHHKNQKDYWLSWNGGRGQLDKTRPVHAVSYCVEALDQVQPLEAMSLVLVWTFNAALFLICV